MPKPRYTPGDPQPIPQWPEREPKGVRPNVRRNCPSCSRPAGLEGLLLDGSAVVCGVCKPQGRSVRLVDAAQALWPKRSEEARCVWLIGFLNGLGALQDGAEVLLHDGRRKA